MHNIQWDDLRFVLELSRTHTLSAAAGVLGVSHTTVARRVSGLEQRLAVRLFDRIDGRYLATAHGERVVEAAVGVEEELLGLGRAIAGRDEQLTGAVRLATMDMHAAWFLHLFASFVAAYPRIELTVLTSYRLHSLDRREADVALRSANHPSDHLVGRRVGRMEYALYAARSLLEARGTRDPAALPWVIWADERDAAETWRRMHRYAPEPDIALRTDSYLPYLGALRAGVGISFFPCFEADQLPDLVRLAPVEPDFGMDLWVLTHPDLRGTARVRALTDHLYDGLSALRDRLEGRPPGQQAS